MRQHVAYGVQITQGAAWLHLAREVIEFHHEKYDGSGYPKGLRGLEIPKVARIFAIVDVFDALVSLRPYKAPLPVAEARQMILNQAGSHFDPDFAAVFASMAERCHHALRGKSSDALIAEIHRRLGRDRIRWTMDALEWLNVEESGAAPVRYKLAKQIEMPKLDFGESIIIGDPRRRPVKPKVKADDKL